MNSLGIALAWCAVQVTVVACAAGLVSLAARRLAPSTRALSLQTGLVVCIALAALAMSPWPRWWKAERQNDRRAADETLSSKDLAETASSRPEVAQGQTPAVTSSTAEPSPASTSAGMSWREFAAAFRELSQRGTATVDATESTVNSNATSWPAILAYVFLGGVALALLRVALGLRAVNLYRRVSLPVTERRLLEQVDVVCAELNCRRQIEVRESAELATPATTGWKNPVIFLPVGWRNWTDLQRLAVLAHEISHVVRNDFLTSMCARVGVALHFYHPLVHWLMRRLTLEQELAADADAARVAGGQRAYLTILAQMALAQSNRRVSWAARTFLPTRGTFLRRIEMLRDSKHLSRPASPGLRMAAVGVLLAAGLLAAGFRAPADRSNEAIAAERLSGETLLAEADETGTGSTALRVGFFYPASATAFELAYVPESAVCVVAGRPADVLARAEWKGLAPLLNEVLAFSKLLDAPVSDIEQAVLAIVPAASSNTPPAPMDPLGKETFGTLTIRMKQPNDFKSLLADFGHGRPFVERNPAGKSYFVAASSARHESYFRPDDRTIVLGLEPAISAATAATAGTQPKNDLVTGANWDRVKDAQVAVAIDSKWAQNFGGIAAGEMAVLSPLFAESNSIAASLELNKGLTFSIFVDCRSEQGAGKVKQTIDAALLLARNALEQFEAKLPPVVREEQPNGTVRLHRVHHGGMMAFVPPAKSLANAAKVEQQGKIVAVNSELADNEQLIAQLAMEITNNATAAREAAQRASSKVNLKRIGLAMHVYHDAHGHLPPAVVLGPDGKTPHSWRVALLPYLEEPDLFKEYNQNEPWDSESNKKVLAKMPAVFRHSSDKSTEPNSSYYVLNGPGSVFDGTKSSGIRDITDGTSNTLLAVEAKRDVPWTKPEDIPYDPEKKLPKLGGFTKDGYNLLLCDGSVRFTNGNLSDDFMKLLIEKADGHAFPPIEDATHPGAGAVPARKAVVPTTPARPSLRGKRGGVIRKTAPVEVQSEPEGTVRPSEKKQE